MAASAAPALLRADQVPVPEDFGADPWDEQDPWGGQMSEGANVDANGSSPSDPSGATNSTWNVLASSGMTSNFGPWAFPNGPPTSYGPPAAAPGLWMGAPGMAAGAATPNPGDQLTGQAAAGQMADRWTDGAGGWFGGSGSYGGWRIVGAAVLLIKGYQVLGHGVRLRLVDGFLPMVVWRVLALWLLWHRLVLSQVLLQLLLRYRVVFLQVLSQLLFRHKRVLKQVLAQPRLRHKLAHRVIRLRALLRVLPRHRLRQAGRKEIALEDRLAMILPKILLEMVHLPLQGAEVMAMTIVQQPPALEIGQAMHPVCLHLRPGHRS